MERGNSNFFAVVLTVPAIVAIYVGAYFMLVTQKFEPHTGAAAVKACYAAALLLAGPAAR